MYSVGIPCNSYLILLPADDMLEVIPLPDAGHIEFPACLPCYRGFKCTYDGRYRTDRWFLEFLNGRGTIYRAPTGWFI